MAQPTYTVARSTRTSPAVVNRRVNIESGENMIPEANAPPPAMRIYFRHAGMAWLEQCDIGKRCKRMPVATVILVRFAPGNGLPPLDSINKHRITGFCFNPASQTLHAQIVPRPDAARMSGWTVRYAVGSQLLKARLDQAWRLQWRSPCPRQWLNEK